MVLDQNAVARQAPSSLLAQPQQMGDPLKFWLNSLIFGGISRQGVKD